MPLKDKDKRKEYQRKYNKNYYQKNKEREIKRIRNRKEKIFRWFKEFRESKSCEECGESHPSTLDFHHKSGKKDLDVVRMVWDGYSIKKIKKEISKCKILCSNCHRKLHWG